MYIVFEHRGRGAAHELMHAAIAWAERQPDVVAITLQVAVIQQTGPITVTLSTLDMWVVADRRDPVITRGVEPSTLAAFEDVPHDTNAGGRPRAARRVRIAVGCDWRCTGVRRADPPVRR